MGVMVSEVYDALLAAGAPEEKARAAAESIPATEQLATKQDVGDLKIALAALEVKMWRMAVAVAGLAVLFNKFLDWAIK